MSDVAKLLKKLEARKHRQDEEQNDGGGSDDGNRPVARSSGGETKKNTNKEAKGIFGLIFEKKWIFNQNFLLNSCLM